MQRIVKIERISIFFLGACILIIMLFSIKTFSVQWKSTDSSENKEIFLHNNENNCGPVALKMIFDHYKIPSTINEIETKVKLSDSGTSMLALKDMSELKGLHAEGWRLTFEDLSKATLPVILFVNGNHFVVADSVKSDTLFFRDPLFGKLTIRINKLPERWNGETLIFKK
jgi:ABC-type bacteriocin/lantibiotic exporter with double-glycine peptidase domain